MRSHPLAVAVLAASLTGCGVSTGGPPQVLAPSEVPYGLLEPAPTSAAPSPVPPAEDRPRVYLVTPEDVLRAAGRDVPDGSPTEQLADLLAQLGAGPTTDEQADELTTALPPGAELSVVGVEDGTVTVDLTGPGDAPSGARSRLAVAQIVLTATSLPGIRAVLLTSDGTPVEAPLPSGALTGAPLTAADFESLLVTPP